MASGIPVIASNIPGYNEIISHGHDGLLVNADTPSDMEHAILYLIKNPHLRLRMGTVAKTTSQKYSWVSITKNIECFYYQKLDKSLARKAINA